MSFYEELAGQYDEITGAASRAAAAEGFARELVARFRPANVLDVACGTGLYALALARAGIRATGADLSPAMLERAAASAKSAGLAIEWICAPMQTLATATKKQFDAVVCMGNSIPHLLTEADLEGTLEGFARLLRPGGVAVVQLLHYEKILASGERIVGVNRAGETQYIRFYDFLGTTLRFNILELAWRGEACEPRLHSTELRPWRHGQLAAAMQRHGLGDVQLFGSPLFAPFDPKTSETVMLVATTRARA